MKIGITSLLCVLSIVFAFTPTHSFAQEPREYTLLTPLPLGTGGTELTKTDFSTYINGMYQFVLGVAGILAVIMIIFAGFTYMTTDAFQKKQEGKDQIKNAILGLLLAIGTWLILNTINPELLKFDLKIQRPSSPTAATQSNGSLIVVGSGNTASEQEARALMEQYGLSTNKEPCAEGVTEGCANFAGIPEIALSAVSTLQTEFCASGVRPCTFNLSGGTEDGHDTHGVNAPILDLSYNSQYSAYIKENGTFVRNSDLGPVYTIGNTTITIEHEGIECTPTSGPCQHFHVVVGQ